MEVKYSRRLELNKDGRTQAYMCGQTSIKDSKSSARPVRIDRIIARHYSTQMPDEAKFNLRQAISHVLFYSQSTSQE